MPWWCVVDIYFYYHIGVGSCVARLPDWAMREPSDVGRASVSTHAFFVPYSDVFQI